MAERHHRSQPTFATKSVISGPDGPKMPFPLYPRKQTSSRHRGRSEKCQQRKSAQLPCQYDIARCIKTIRVVPPQTNIEFTVKRFREPSQSTPESQVRLHTGGKLQGTPSRCASYVNRARKSSVARARSCLHPMPRSPRAGPCLWTTGSRCNESFLNCRAAVCNGGVGDNSGLAAGNTARRGVKRRSSAGRHVSARPRDCASCRPSRVPPYASRRAAWCLLTERDGQGFMSTRPLGRVLISQVLQAQLS